MIPVASAPTALIRTSDRLSFKQCRRRWHWQSGLRNNLEPIQQASPLWFGSGIHWALEDYYDKRISGPRLEDSFDLYVQATKMQGLQRLPDDWQELQLMGKGMLNYYQDLWLKEPGRREYETFYVDGVPQLEINFQIDVPFALDPKSHYTFDSDGSRVPYERVVYSGTIDRMVIDPDDGDLWLVDYKSAKAVKEGHFEVDQQVSSYCWAASRMYPGHKIKGMIYWQFAKRIPDYPMVLKSGHLSVNKQQVTSQPLYREAMRQVYGKVSAAPSVVQEFFGNLQYNESPEGDRFVRQDKVYRNEHQCEAEGVKILLELEDMLRGDLPLYPNPNFMCPGLCPFFEACVSVDDGSDWETSLLAETQQRSPMDESWRAYIPQILERRNAPPEMVFES